MNIGFIGLGRMGWPIAKRLMAAGHRITVYDAVRDAPGATDLRAMRERLKQALEGLAEVSLDVKTHDSGKLFGSVTAADVAGAIKTAGGPTLDKRSVELPKGHIKATGSYPVVVNLHPQVSATVQLAVVAAS